MHFTVCQRTSTYTNNTKLEARVPSQRSLTRHVFQFPLEYTSNASYCNCSRRCAGSRVVSISFLASHRVCLVDLAVHLTIMMLASNGPVTIMILASNGPV